MLHRLRRGRLRQRRQRRQRQRLLPHLDLDRLLHHQRLLLHHQRLLHLLRRLVGRGLGLLHRRHQHLRHLRRLRRRLQRRPRQLRRLVRPLHEGVLDDAAAWNLTRGCDRSDEWTGSDEYGRVNRRDESSGE
jgi:hypothetical protein